jgi:hypothetical protein
MHGSLRLANDRSTLMNADEKLFLFERSRAAVNIRFYLCSSALSKGGSR